MTIEQRVDQTVEQSMNIRKRLLADLADLDRALRRAEETARQLPDADMQLNVIIKQQPKGWRWPWRR